MSIQLPRPECILAQSSNNRINFGHHVTDFVHSRILTIKTCPLLTLNALYVPAESCSTQNMSKTVLTH